MTRKKLITNIYVKLSFLLLVGFFMTPIFISVNKVSAQSTDSGGANTFFCKTRYSKNIDSHETERREACQRGYDGGGCPGTADEDGIKDACMAGANADKPIPDEPTRDKIDANINTRPTTPPDMSSTSISGDRRCGSVDTAYVVCPNINSGGISGSPVWSLLSVILNIAIVLVGIVAIGSLVYTGFVYATASDDQARVRQALSMLKNIMIGVALFALMYAVLQFIIPGGIFD